MATEVEMELTRGDIRKVMFTLEKEREARIQEKEENEARRRVSEALKAEKRRIPNRKLEINKAHNRELRYGMPFFNPRSHKERRFHACQKRWARLRPWVKHPSYLRAADISLLIQCVKTKNLTSQQATTTR